MEAQLVRNFLHLISMGAIGLGEGLLRRVFSRKERSEPWPDRLGLLARNFLKRPARLMLGHNTVIPYIQLPLHVFPRTWLS